MERGGALKQTRGRGATGAATRKEPTSKNSAARPNGPGGMFDYVFMFISNNGDSYLLSH